MLPDSKLDQLRQSPQLWRFVAVAAVALLARALVVAVVLASQSCPLDRYTDSADGYQGKVMARAWKGDFELLRKENFFRSMVESRGLASSHLLRFYPVGAGTLALGTAVGLPEGLVATVPFWLFAAMAAGLVAVWARDARAGLLVGLLPPIAVYKTTFLNSSGLLLAFAVAGLLLLRRERPIAAGLALGLAGWCRPEGIFPAVGAVAALAVDGKRREALQLGAAAAATQIALAGVIVARFGPLLREILTSDSPTAMGSPAFIDIPGRALWNAFTSPQTPTWKLVYVGVHLLVGLAALAVLSRRARREQASESRRESITLLVWLSLQLLLVSSLHGSQGFDDLPRYLALASPAMVAAFVPWLPRAKWPIALVCAASVAIALIPAMKNARPECSSAAGVAYRSAGE